jgi:Spy/CpxP family protein refolding chaperone
MVKRQFLTAIGASVWLAAAASASAQSANSQTAPAPQDDKRVAESIDLMRRDIRSQKKQLIAQNLTLSDTEATKFWPIYDKYTAELVKINDKRYATLQQYAQNYGSLSDEQAIKLVKDWQDVEIQTVQLRSKYIPIVADAIGGRKAAAFAQLDNRIAMMIDLQLSSQIPIVRH